MKKERLILLLLYPILIPNHFFTFLSFYIHSKRKTKRYTPTYIGRYKKPRKYSVYYANYGPNRTAGITAR